MMKSVAKLIEDGCPIGVTYADNIQIIAIGDLTKFLSKAIEKALEEKLCTFTITNYNHIKQEVYRCYTCYPHDHNMTVCPSCIKKCHNGHEVEIKILSESKVAFCDCGAGDSPIECQCLQ